MQPRFSERSTQNTGDGQVEMPMPVNVAKRLQGPQRPISCIVGLTTVNECLGGPRSSSTFFRLPFEHPKRQG